MRTPINQNPLQASKFQMIFPRISTAMYFCQDVNIPGISANPVAQPNPFIDLPRPGDKMTYEQFAMKFVVDEDMLAWEMIHDWIQGYSFPHDFSEYKNLKYQANELDNLHPPQYSDGQLTVLSALNNPKFNVNFINIFPISLSGIRFDTMTSSEYPVTATATFIFHHYKLERI